MHTLDIHFKYVRLVKRQHYNSQQSLQKHRIISFMYNSIVKILYCKCKKCDFCTFYSSYHLLFAMHMIFSRL